MIWHNLDTGGVMKGNQRLQNNEFSTSASVKDIHFEFGSLAHSYLLRDNHRDLWSNSIGSFDGLNLNGLKLINAKVSVSLLDNFFTI